MKMKWLTAFLVSLTLVIPPGIAGCAAPGALSPVPKGTPPAVTPALSPSKTVESGTALPTGTLVVRVTDAPPKDEVTGIILTISRIEVHKAQAGQEASPGTPSPTLEEEGGWFTVAIPGGGRALNLIKIKGLEEVLATGELGVGRYTQVRLTVDKAEVALGGGVPEPASVPSGELKFVHSFEIKAGEVTELLLDFDAEKSVNITGSDRVTVMPTVRLITKKE